MRILDPSLTDQARSPDPNDPAQNTPQQLPPNVRDFGFIPDCSCWKPGDLVLFSAVDMNFMQRQIVTAQERQHFAPADSEWHHVAVYIGERFICEARPGGTRYHTVDDLVVGHRIRVRRGIKITYDEGYRIAIRAMMRLNRRYDYMTVIRSWAHMLLRKRYLAEPTRYQPLQAVHCARLFHDAYQEVTKRALVERADAVVMPAELSGSSDLHNVQSHWLRLDP